MSGTAESIAAIANLQEDRSEPLPEVKAMGIGWSRGAAFIPSGLIQRLDACPPSRGHWFRRRSNVNHVYLWFAPLVGEPYRYESHVSGGVQITPQSAVARATEAGKQITVREMILTHEPRLASAILEDCRALHGTGYDRLKILVYHVWCRFFRQRGKPAWLGFGGSERYTCNEFTATVLGKWAQPLGLPRLDPDLHTPTRQYWLLCGEWPIYGKKG